MCLIVGGDKIAWEGAMKGDPLVVRDVYSYITLQSLHDNTTSDFYKFSLKGIPTKIILFRWLVWRKKILMWDSIIKRGQSGLGRCALCLLHEEMVDHLFFSCPLVLLIWKLFSPYLMDSRWAPMDFMDIVHILDKISSLLIWEAWLARNK